MHESLIKCNALQDNVSVEKKGLFKKVKDNLNLFFYQSLDIKIKILVWFLYLLWTFFFVWALILPDLTSRIWEVESLVLFPIFTETHFASHFTVVFFMSSFPAYYCPFIYDAFGTCFRGAVLSGAYGREYAADPYIGHSIGPVAGYGVGPHFI